MTHDFSIAPRCLELEGMQATSGNEHPSEDTLCLSYVLSSFHFPHFHLHKSSGRSAIYLIGRRR